jgi:hypothetical protein
MSLFNWNKKVKKPVRIIKPVKERRLWDWDTTNPTAFSLIRSGHGIILARRYEICASEIMDTIQVFDIHNMDSIIDLKGITKENLDEAITIIKKIIKCSTHTEVKG